MNNIFTILAILISFYTSYGQIYLEGKKNKYRFAQTAIGLDIRTTYSRGSFYTSGSQGLIEHSFQPDLTPILTIAGTHFWGHAEFFTGFALFNLKLKQPEADYYFKRNAGTGFKIYPIRLKYHKIVPYIGTSFSSFTFKTTEGPKLSRIEFPLLFGVSYSSRHGLLEIGGNYYFRNHYNHYLNPITEVPLRLPHINLSAKYKYLIDFTVLSEKREAKGDLLKNYNNLKESGGMNSFYISSGFTNSYVVARSSYNYDLNPHMDDYRISNIIPEFSIGYHHHELDGNVFLEYRRLHFKLQSGNEIQQTTRRSWNLGVSKYVGNYHGFNPFIGISLSAEKIEALGKKEGITLFNTSRDFVTYGLMAGWDIKPTNVDWWTVRSNIRYYPMLKIGVPQDKNINISQIEVNFFQFVFLVNRFHKLNKKAKED